MPHEPRTRAHEIPFNTDVNPPVDFGEVLKADAARAAERERVQTGAGAELSAQAEVLQNDVLDALARAQTTALRETMIAVDPTLTDVEDAALVDAFLDLQLSDPNQALTIMNDSIARATEIIEARGYNSHTMATAIVSALASAGNNIEGLGQDVAQTNMGRAAHIGSAAQNAWQGNFNESVQNLSQMEVSGILTVLLAGGAGWRLVGPRTGLGLAAFATILQNQHLTDLTINVASGLGRAATQAVALPVRGGMRTMAILNSAGQSGFMESLVNNGVGMRNDAANSLGYIADGDYSPENGLRSNEIRQEFYKQGEEFAPEPLKPFVLYLKEIQNGGPITALPSEQQAREAGAFIAQVENLVTLDEFTDIQIRRTSGETLSPEDNRKYILYKYCMIVNSAFIGNRGIIPYAEAMTEANENETGELNLEQAFASLDPTLLRRLDNEDFSWDAAEIANFKAQIEGLPINFQTLTSNGGFVGLAGAAYIALTMAGFLFQAGRGVTRWVKSVPRKVINRVKTVDRRPFPASRSRQVVEALSRDRNRLSTVIKPLVAGDALANSSEFSRVLRRTRLSQINETQRNRFKTVVENENATTAEIRNAFFTLLENSGVNIDANAMAQRRDFYRYREALSQINTFYNHDRRNTDREIAIGARTLSIGHPDRGRFNFLNLRSLVASPKSPAEFYDYMNNNGAGRTLNLKNRADHDVVLNLRRNNNQYEYRIGTAGNWETFNLNDFASSVSTSLQPAAVEGTTS